MSGGARGGEMLRVRRAVPADVLYIASLARHDSEALGFLPRVVYERVIDGDLRRHRLWLVEVDADPVGFLYASPGEIGRAARAIQICVQPDARRFEYATELVRAAEQWATSLQRPALGLHVATDLEATKFWDALGYEVRGHVVGGQRRQRTLEDRVRLLDVPLLSDARIAVPGSRALGPGT